MSNRGEHYEKAFEDYLRAKGLPYVSVDDAKKSIFGAVPLKSFDFVVYSSGGSNLLVDVKGRKFPDSIPRAKRGGGKAWENWITQGDVAGLREWETVFGGGFCSVLVFAYWLQGPPQRAPFEDVHLFRENYYAFLALPLAEYVTLSKPRSEKWKTLGVPAKPFAQAARDIASFL
jgi:hypothetical protein